MIHYIDAFSGYDLAEPQRRVAAFEVVPALIRALDDHGMAPLVSHSLDDVARFQAEAQKQDPGIARFQLFDPRHQPDASVENTVAIFLEHTESGRRVACAGTRLLWIETTLAEEMESQRLFYPSSSPREGERVIVAPQLEVARRISSCHVAFTGAIYALREYRKASATEAMLRLLHLWVVAHWRWSWLVGLTREAVTRAFGLSVYGYTAASKGVYRLRSPDDRMQDREYYLVTARRGEAKLTYLRPDVADLARPLGMP